MLAVIPFGGSPWGSCNPTDYEDVTVTNGVAVGLTASKITGSIVAVFIRVELANVRVRVDGGTPVTAGGTGILLFDTELLILNNIQAKALKAIADGATSATLRVTYLKGG